ncbi:MAG: hypothetical protein MJ189_01815 [Coriobacteriales bacterium]|nr:hypothetical protein [Coriobacteriales bacterium]
MWSSAYTTGDNGGRKKGERVGIDFALIGKNISHSLSANIHNKFYKSKELNFNYSLQECADEQIALYQMDLVRMGHYRGLNITTPYKELASTYADFSSEAVKACAGANVLVRVDLEVYAYNTDGIGAICALKSQGQISLKNKSVCICGSGPCARAIIFELLKEEVGDIVVISRNPSKAKKMIVPIVDVLGTSKAEQISIYEYGQISMIVSFCDIFINATSVDLCKANLVDANLFFQDQVVMDVNYKNSKNLLILAARENDAIAFDGKAMLYEQAAKSINIWTRALGFNLNVEAKDLLMSMVIFYN